MLLENKVPSYPTQYKNPVAHAKRSDAWTVSLEATPGRHKKKQKVLVTLSGGQDSSLVTWVLFHTQHYYPCRPQSLHYQHFLQSDAVYAKKHCSQLSFWFNWETLSCLATRECASEKNAGDWRKDSSFRISTYYTCPIVFKGQSLSDQYETTTATILCTIVKEFKKDLGVQEIARSPTQTRGPLIEHNHILFSQSKKLSRWVPMTSGRNSERGVKLYRGIKYGL